MPLPSAPSGGHDFTGRTRLRRSLFGRLILQLEEKGGRDDPSLRARQPRWRDVRRDDLWRLRATREHNKMDGLI